MTPTTQLSLATLPSPAAPAAPARPASVGTRRPQPVGGTPVTQLRTRRLRQLPLDTEPGRRSGPESARSPQRLRSQCTDGTRLTLAQSLSSVWEGLDAVGAADCLICGASMVQLPDGTGACGGCGTTLS